MERKDTTNPFSPKVIDRSFFIELTVDDYAEEQKTPTFNDYYPCSFFTSLKNDTLPDIFNKENGRFQRYAREMYSFYKEKLSKSEDNVFIEQMIIGKVSQVLNLV